jgi:hypothetical protein
MNYAPKMQDVLRNNLLVAVEQLAVARGIAKTNIVRAISGHPAVWARIKQGRSPVTTALYDRMMGGISALWPEDAPWPDGVLRPAPDPQSVKRPDFLDQQSAA